MKIANNNTEVKKPNGNHKNNIYGLDDNNEYRYVYPKPNRPINIQHNIIITSFFDKLYI